LLDIVAIGLSVTALLAYINYRFIGLPTTIGVMVTALTLSLAIVGLDALGIAHLPKLFARSFVDSIDFSELLLQGMLSLLLFAGALHVNLARLRRYRLQILALAFVSTAASTVIVGAAVWFVSPYLHLELPLPYCLLFGALISPTDPVAVMGLMRTSGSPPELETVITGESLFNDGVGVVLFSLIMVLVNSGRAPSPSVGALDLLREAGGGMVFGAALGFVMYRLLKSVDQYQVEVLITLAGVLAGYAAAIHLGVSGPLAMVVAGVLTGNRAREHAMSETTRRYVDMFWEIIDEILNALLFVLIGLEVLLIAFPARVIVAGLVAFAVSVLSRLITVGAPVALAGRHFDLPAGSWKVLTWGGLRGGISVALALSIPAGPARDSILAITYCVVVSSIMIQGLTIAPVVRNALRPASVSRSADDGS
jgi:CPA1 family monovalent cation:H+ antiporter